MNASEALEIDRAAAKGEAAAEKKMASITVAVTVDQKQALGDRAGELGVSQSDLMRRGLGLVLGFDADFLKYTAGMAKSLAAPEFVVIQNAVIKVMAERAAERIDNSDVTHVLHEYVREVDAEGNAYVVTGKPLLEMLRASRYRELKREQRAEKRAVDGGAPVEAAEDDIPRHLAGAK